MCVCVCVTRDMTWKCLNVEFWFRPLFLPVADGKVGGACTGTAGTQGGCEDSNALCSSMSKCDCKPGYLGTPGGVCTQSECSGRTE